MIVIDAIEFKDRDSTYKTLNREFDFDIEVHNLDALFDELSLCEEKIKILNYRYIYTNLDNYGQKLIMVFLDLVRKYNIDISLIY